MNIEQLQKQLNQDKQYRRSVGDLINVDWNWRVTQVDKKEGRVDLQSHHYGLALMSDQIQSFLAQ